jgi:hypothetical protein
MRNTQCKSQPSADTQMSSSNNTENLSGKKFVVQLWYNSASQSMCNVNNLNTWSLEEVLVQFDLCGWNVSSTKIQCQFTGLFGDGKMRVLPVRKWCTEFKHVGGTSVTTVALVGEAQQGQKWCNKTATEFWGAKSQFKVTDLIIMKKWRWLLMTRCVCRWFLPLQNVWTHARWNQCINVFKITKNNKDISA